MIVFMSFFILMSSASGYVIHREWARREKAGAQTLKAVAELKNSLARTKRLEGFISICMHCKKIHNGRDSWEQIEKYISEHTDAQFSHGVCPECYARHYNALSPGIASKDKK
jgi:ribosomal protein L40E